VDEWKRLKAIRRLLWVAAALCIFPGSFFITIWAAYLEPSMEALVALFPAGVMASVAFALHWFEPARPVAMVKWEPEEELLGPVPRKVESRWSTPRLTLPVMLGLFPAFYLLVVLVERRAMRWDAFLLLATPLALAALRGFVKQWGPERKLVVTGEPVRGLIKRMVTSRGFFRMKVQYEYEGEKFFGWSPNLSQTSWFGPLLVEEFRSVTLLVDPLSPERFTVYRFCGHEVPGAQADWALRGAEGSTAAGAGRRPPPGSTTTGSTHPPTGEEARGSSTRSRRLPGSRGRRSSRRGR